MTMGSRFWYDRMMRERADRARHITEGIGRMQDTQTIADKDARIERLTAALTDCAIHAEHPDCCGVCQLHFADCESERQTTEEPPYDTPEKLLSFTYCCAGARARLALGISFPVVGLDTITVETPDRMRQQADGTDVSLPWKGDGTE